MKPLIPPFCYSDIDIFKQEQVILFQNLWNFAGFAWDLANHNEYICTEIGTHSITVQNFHGELRAFRNVCSHRFSRIRQQPQGNGPLQCPYHRWTYNSEGIPVGIPRQSEFENLTDTTREYLKLEPWLVDQCGKFMFVKRKDDGVSLKEFLGNNYDKLKNYSEAIGTRVDRYEIVVKANWKIIVENTLESYHVWAVHEKTFARSGVTDEDLYFDYPHSSCSNRGMSINSRARRAESVFASRKLKTDKYHHCLAFPTLTVSTPSGIWFGVHSIHPISPCETKVIVHLFICKLEGNREKIILDVGCQEVIDFVRTVWDEDKPICEQVQLGISSLNNAGGIFSREEQRVYEFHKAYLDVMNYSR